MKCFSSSQRKYMHISQVVLNVKSTFEIEIVLIDKIEQLTKQKLSPSCTQINPFPSKRFPIDE